RLTGTHAGIESVQPDRDAVLVDAVVGVVLAGIQRRTSRTLRNAAGQGKVIAAGVTVDLEAGVAVDVPAEAQARSPLRRGQAQIRFAGSVVVRELVVAQTQLDQPAVTDLPAVLDVLGALRDTERPVVVIPVFCDVVARFTARLRCGVEHPRTGFPAGTGIRAAGNVVVGQRIAIAIGHLVVFPSVAETGFRELGARIDVGHGLVVDTTGDGVIAQLVAQIDAKVGIRGAMARQVDGRHRLAVVIAKAWYIRILVG